MTRTIYLIDVGVLIEDKNHPDYRNYANVYDKKHGYYDENQYYEPDLQTATDAVRKYVSDGVDGTYGVISATQADSSMTDDEIRTANVEHETYDKENVVFSMAKRDSRIISPLISVKTDPDTAS